MNISQTIALDFGRDTVPVTVFAKQFDKKSRFIEITPLNGGQSYALGEGITARLQLTKADGHTVINDGKIEGGKITVELTEQALAAAGTAVAEIGLYKGEALLSSQIFYIKVERAAYDPKAPESSDEYNALVTALGKVDGSVAAADEMARLANEAAGEAARAAENANTAATKADTARTAADKAATAANTAKKNADTATTNANAASESANNAANAANNAAGAANKATEGASKVDIKAVQTATGATVTVTDREGVATEVHIDTLTAVNTWEDIKNAVRLGLGEKLFPVGYEFETEDSVTGAIIVWVVRGHNHHTAANGKLEYTMTLEMKCVYGTASGTYKAMQFDSTEAVYYAEQGLAAGTYNFTVANQAWYTADNGKTYQFTLAQAVPAGGQLVLSMTYNAALEGKSVKTYASPTSTAAIETATLTQGAAGTSLGTTNGSGNMNYMHRAIFGSNNYAQSALRQWLNSNAPAGSVWSPTNVFDRPPSWVASEGGFMRGLPEDFLEAVQIATIPCRTNSVYEHESLDGTPFAINQVYSLEDKFFLLSRPEIYGTWDSASYKDGELLEYYGGLTDTERIKRDENGSARTAWLRSPYPSYAGSERVVDTSGSVGSGGAYDAIGVAAACIIA